MILKPSHRENILPVLNINSISIRESTDMCSLSCKHMHLQYYREYLVRNAYFTKIQIKFPSLESKNNLSEKFSVRKIMPQKTLKVRRENWVISRLLCNL